MASLGESLDNVVECCTLWKEGSAEECSTDMHAWADEVVEKLLLINEALWFSILAAFDAGCLREFDLSPGAVAKFSAVVEEHFSEEGPLLEFIANFQKQLAKMPATAERLSFHEPALRGIAEQSEARTAAVDAAMMLLTLDTLPQDPQQALGGWKNKSNAGFLRDSFLEKRLELWAHFRLKLAQRRLSTPKPPSGVADEVRITIGAHFAVVSWAKLENIYDDLLNAPLVNQIAGTLQAAVQISYDHFIATLSLKEMRYNVQADVASFYSGNTSDLVKASAKVFAAGGTVMGTKKTTPLEEPSGCDR